MREVETKIMISHQEFKTRRSYRPGECGAALLTTLLIATLLLSAGLALVLSTSISSTTTIDATAEMQAYFAAEAGLEATLNVLRGNVAPDSSLAGTQMSLRNAANPTTSNKLSDALRTGSSARSRLSGWLNYSYQNPTVVTDWRVPLSASYAPFTGIAYRVEITDPDDEGPIATRKITTDPSYEPTRLRIRSEGYGPKGAIKRLEMIVRSGDIEFNSPATITLVGGSAINLQLGESANVRYSGTDSADPPMAGIPAVAVSPGNETAAQTEINDVNGSCPGGTQVSPCAAGILTASNTPSFLVSADEARAFLIRMKARANELGRSFSTKAQANDAGGLGTTANPTFTFIDNYGTSSTPGPTVDLGPGHQGSGLLIVTGNLETNGNTDFEGLILVLGRGTINRSGGGTGLIRGSIIVANFDPNGAPGTGFGTPSFSISGGGNSYANYDSEWVRRAMSLSGFQVIGVREYH
jgi:hypothetical protein